MAAIDLNTVRSTIEGRLATELASSPAIPVVFNNMAFDSTTDKGIKGLGSAKGEKKAKNI